MPSINHLGLYRDLFTAAERYFDATPWESLAAELPICVDNPRTGERSLCVGMGGSGIVRGLAIYVGKAGQSAYDRTIEYSGSFSGLDDEVHPSWSLYSQHALKLEFVNADEKTEFTKQLHKELGLRFRGRMRHPQPEWFAGGFWPINNLDEEQILHLTECLDIVANVARRPIEEIDKIYEYVEADSGDYVFQLKEGQWSAHELPRLEVGRWEVLPIPKLPPTILPKSLWQEEGLTLAVLAVPMNSPVADPKDPSPYFPILFLAVNTENGLIVNQQIFSPNSLQDELGEWLVEVVRSNAPLGKFIACSDEPTEYLLSGFANRYGIEVKAFPDHEGFQQLLHELGGMMPGI